MRGKTHLACGCATALTLLGVNNVPTVIAGMTLATIGSIMPDIDIKNSTARKELKSTVFIAGALGVVAPFLSKMIDIDKINLTSALHLSKGAIPGLGLLILYILLGINSEHRGFTHTIEGLAISSFAVWLITPTFYPWYIAAYVSHIAIDLLNKKKLKLSMLAKRGFCLNLCTATGGVDYLIRAVSILLVFYKLFTLQS